MKLVCLLDRDCLSLIAGGGCEAAVTGRTVCVWLRSRDCGELLYGRRFPLRQKGAVYDSMHGLQYCM